jgi:adenosylcobinamide-phosphate synthase
MSFFAILIALLIEQARPLAPANLVHAGYRAWTVSVRRNFDAGQAHHGWLAWTVAVALPCVLVMGIYLLLLWGCSGSPRWRRWGWARWAPCSTA